MKLFKAFKRFTVFIVSFFILICLFSVSAESIHPFESYMPTPIYENNIPVSAVFINYYHPINNTYYQRYMYSTLINNNFVYEDTPFFYFHSGDFFSFYFSTSDSVWVYKGSYDTSTYFFTDVSIDWILENANIYCNVDIVDVDGNILFNRNSNLVDGLLVPYDFIGGSEVPDYDSWADRIFGEITSWFSGVLEVLATPFTAIAEGLNGVWQAIKNIPQLIADKLEYLFVPSGDKFSELKDKFDEKFGFVGQIIDLGETIINATFGGSKPESNITLYGGTYTIIDWDIYDDYRPYVHGIIVLLSYIVFIPKLIRRLPSIIRGI